MFRLSERRFAVPDLVGSIGLTLFALGLGIGGGAIRLGLGLMVLACLLDWRRFWPRVRADGVFWLALGIAAYLSLLALARIFAEGADAGRTLAGLLTALAHSGGLAILVGWVLGGRHRRVTWMFALALVGLLWALFRFSSLAEVATYLSGMRASYGLGGNGPGLYFGVALLGLFSLGLAGLASASGRLARLAWSASFCLGAVLLTVPILFNQSRAAWLATLVVLPAMLLTLAFARALPRYPARVWAAAFAALAAMALTVQAVDGIVAERIRAEQAVVAKIAQGQAVAPESSAGARVGLWQVAVAAIQARPLFGHGPGAARELIGAHPHLATYPHFHNLYLQILAESGALGLIAVVAIYGFLAGALYRGWRGGGVAGELALFLLAAWVFYFVVSLFLIRHDDMSGVAFLGMLMGATHTFRLHRGALQPAPE